MRLRVLFLLPLFTFGTWTSAADPKPFLNASQRAVLEEILDVHLDYFLSDVAVTQFGFPLTAVKEGDRARFGYSNPTEWGYTLLAWTAAADRGKISIADAGTRLETALDTMINLQIDPNQNYNKLFYPFYTVTNSAGVDLPQPVHDSNLWIPSIDDGFLYTSLIIVRGWAEDKNLTAVESKARTVFEAMNFRVFLNQGGNLMAHLINAGTGNLGAAQWDVYSDEGGMMAWIAYLSDSITFDEYKNLIRNMRRESRSYQGITVQEAQWFNPMFTWGVRTLAGFPVATWESGIHNRYSQNSFTPNVKAHLQYGSDINVYYPAFSDAMTHAGLGGVGVYTPPNLPDIVPTAAPQHAIPHALFIPLNVGPDLGAPVVNQLIGKISDLKNDLGGYYHDGSDSHLPFGFEVSASPFRNQTSYPGFEGRFNFETLNHSYIALSIHQALNIQDGTPTFFDHAARLNGYREKVQRVLAFLYPVSASPTIRVPEDYTTIQAAINASSPGDTIQVAPGTYNENLILNKSGIVLSGTNQDSVIRGSGSQPVIFVENIAGANPVIKGFTITGGGYGIRLDDTVSDIRIEGNLITANTSSESGYGIYLDKGVDASIVNNVISFNGKGIYGRGNNDVEIDSNQILSNRGSHGGGIVLSEGRGIIIKNRIAFSWDGAIILTSGSDVDIVENTLRNNDSWDEEAGISVSDSRAVLWKNQIAEGKVFGRGLSAGLYATSATVEIYNNVFHGLNFNTGSTRSGAAVYMKKSAIIAKNNIFSSNGASGQPNVVFYTDGVSQNFSHNNFWDNRSSANTSGVVLGPGHLFQNPLYVNINNFALGPNSPCTNAGDPDPQFNDADGSRNDMGIYGAVYNADINNTPVITPPIPDQSINLGGTFTSINLDDHVFDSDNFKNELSWTVQGAANLNAAIDQNRVAHITPASSGWFGTEAITFQVNDPGGLIAQDTVLFTVNAPANGPPVFGLGFVSFIQMPGGVVETTGTVLQLDMELTDPDLDPLTVTLENVPDFVTYHFQSPNTHILKIDASTGPTGQFSGICIKASDSVHVSSVTFDLKVHLKPSMIAPVEVQGPALEEITFDVFGQDPEDGFNVHLSTTNRFPFINGASFTVIGSTGQFAWTPRDDQTGLHNIEFIVFDQDAASQTHRTRIIVASPPPPPPPPSVLRVPEDFSTIQAAIDAAQFGNTIQVAAGSYTENLNLNKSGIVLQGDNQLSVIDGESDQPVITAQNISGAETVVEGFKITGGASGIRCTGSVQSLHIRENFITRNLSQTIGTGVYLEDGCDIFLATNTISFNGKGVFGEGNNNVEILANNIQSNRGALGGGLILSGATGLIRGNTITSSWDGAIQIKSGSDVDLVQNILRGNDSWNSTAGIYINQSTATLWQNQVAFGTVHNFGPSAGLYALNSTISLYNNIFHVLRLPSGTTKPGTAMHFSQTNVIAKNNIVSANGRGGEPTVVFYSSGEKQDFSYNNFWGNLSVAPTGGITVGEGTLFVDPLFVNTVDFVLGPGSPCLDAGDPDPQFNDADGTRNDMGIYGGVYNTGINHPPVFTSNIPNQIIPSTGSFMPIDLDAYAFDPDHTQNELTWVAFGQGNLNITIDPTHTAVITPVISGWTGTESVTFRVIDPGGLSAEDTADFTILPPPNDPPVFGSGFVSFIHQPGGVVETTGTVRDVDMGLTDPQSDPITVTLQNQPSFVTYIFQSPNTHRLRIDTQTGQTGTFSNIGILASDGIHVSSVTFDLRVHLRPSLTGPSEVSAEVLSEIQFDVVGMDPEDGTNVVVSTAGDFHLMAGASFVAPTNTGHFSWTPQTDQGGTYNADFIVYDQDGASATHRTRVIVNEPPPPPPPPSNVLRVPEDFSTIQAAINAAAQGDTIQVAAGTYNEVLFLNKSGIILRGENRLSVIDGVPDEPVIEVQDITGADTLIEGFKITGGEIGLQINDTVKGLIINDNQITRNLSNLSGTGIYMDKNSSATITNNEISYHGVGIIGKGDNTVRIESNEIFYNRGSGGGGIQLSGTTGLIKDNRITSNWDGAIEITNGSDVTLIKNRLRGNEAWNGIANLYVADSKAVLWQNLFTFGKVYSRGRTPGIYATDADIELYNNIIHGMLFTQSGGSKSGAAMYVKKSNIVAKNNIISVNGTNGAPNVVYFTDIGSQETSYNNYWGNRSVADTTGVVLGTGHLFLDPRYVNTVDFVLGPGSPCIDAGDPSPQFNDANGTRNDMGIYGGPVDPLNSSGSSSASSPRALSVQSEPLSVVYQARIRVFDKELVCCPEKSLPVKMTPETVATLAPQWTFEGRDVQSGNVLWTGKINSEQGQILVDESNSQIFIVVLNSNTGTAPEEVKVALLETGEFVQDNVSGNGVSFFRNPSTPLQMDIAENKTIDIVARRTAKEISGQVLDAYGTPVRGISVYWDVSRANQIDRWDEQDSVQTNTLGQFFIQENLKADLIVGPNIRLRTKSPQIGATWQVYSAESAQDIILNKTFYLDSPSTSALDLSPRSGFNRYVGLKNKFNPSRGEQAQIEFNVYEAAHVNITLFDRFGRVVKELTNRSYSAGTFEEPWSGRDNDGLVVASGVYHVVIQIGNHTQKSKIIVSR